MDHTEFYWAVLFMGVLPLVKTVLPIIETEGR